MALGRDEHKRGNLFHTATPAKCTHTSHFNPFSLIKVILENVPPSLISLQKEAQGTTGQIATLAALICPLVSPGAILS